MKNYNRLVKQLTVSTMLSLAVVQPLHIPAALASAAHQHIDSGLVPLRETAAAIGATVKWDQSRKEASITRGNVQFTVKAGSNKAALNGAPYSLSSAAAAINQRLMVPLSAMQEAFQAELAWNPEDGLKIAGTDLNSTAAHFVYLLLNGRYENAHAMMNAALQTRLPAAALPQYWAANTAALGVPQDLKSLTLEANKVHRNVKLMYATDKGAPFSITVRFDARGGIDDLFIAPAADGAYKAPSYDNPQLYTEEELVLDQGEWDLPATLTMPAGQDGKPRAAVVLVHGSGPNDRDETIGSYKTFRDLAVGLAAQNIAVLRYEKVTREHSLKASTNPGFTVMEETVNDALTAVKALAKDARLDPDRIFVIGHSQGGMLVPRMIENDKNGQIAGAVIMAGPSRPFEDILLEQNKDALAAAKEAGAYTPEMGAQLDALEQQIAMLKDPKYSADNLPAGFALGTPAWWFDFRNNYGGEIAKHQQAPLLILQGDNDFQVKASELEGWKMALSERQNISYKLYPRLNHGFVPYDQPSTGAEYAIPGNVPAEVIEDIASWLKQQHR